MTGKWVVPYIDQPPDFWQEVVDRFGPHIREVYFPVPDGAVPSGRSRQPEAHLQTFLTHARAPKSVLVNPIVLPAPMDVAAPGILRVLRELRDRYGVHRVTVTNPSLARRVKQKLPDFHVNASVLMGISTPLQVMMVRDCVDAITVDNTLVRNLPALTRFRQAFSGELRMIVNEACLPGCPHRVQHFFEMGYGRHFPQSLCQEVLNDTPWLRLTGAWILPQHLKYVEGLCDSFKLAGRVTLRQPERFLQVLGAYVARTPMLASDIGGGPASLLDPIEIDDEFFEATLHCDRQCGQCTICRDYYERATTRKESNHGK